MLSEQQSPPNDEFSKVNFDDVLSFFKIHKNKALQSLLVSGDQFWAVFTNAADITVENFSCDSFDKLKTMAIQSWANGKILQPLAVDRRKAKNKFAGQIVENPAVSQSLISVVQIADFVQSPKSRIESCFYHNSRNWFLINHHQALQTPQKLTFYYSFKDLPDTLKDVCCVCVDRIGLNLTFKLLVIENDSADTHNAVDMTNHRMWCNYVTDLKKAYERQQDFFLLSLAVPLMLAPIILWDKLCSGSRAACKPDGVEFFKLYE